MRTRLAELSLMALAGWLLGMCAVASAAGAAQAKTPVATVAGQTIFEDDLLPLIQARLRPLQAQEYELKSKALEDVIQKLLLKAEAEKEGLSAEALLAREADSHVTEPTDAEVESRPRVDVALDPQRVRGNPDAPVSIVEFSDFQCPYCRRIQPTLRKVLAKYENRVSLSFRDFPLRQIHPQAQLAAEAARCAEEQGKFWEYHDALFGASKLDREGLVQQARAVELDEDKFDACLTAGRYKAQIDQDLQDGKRAGVSGTPAFFINGILLSGAQPLDSFSKVIDEELAKSGS